MMNFNDMVKSGYFMYMAEAEGCDNLVSTRTAKINAAIKYFKYIIRQGENPNYYIDDILAKHNLTEDMLTDAEKRKIMREVDKYGY